MKTLFAPGCALNHYKPDLISRISQFLMKSSIIDGMYLTCCKPGQTIADDIKLITCCPGCSYKCCGGCACSYEARKVMALKRAGVFTEKNVVVYCTAAFYIRSLQIREWFFDLRNTFLQVRSFSFPGKSFCRNSAGEVPSVFLKVL